MDCVQLNREFVAVSLSHRLLIHTVAFTVVIADAIDFKTMSCFWDPL